MHESMRFIKRIVCGCSNQMSFELNGFIIFSRDMSAFCNIYIKLSLTLIIYFPELLNEHGIICNNGNNSP